MNALLIGSRRLRGELRLYGRPAVVAVAVCFAGVVASALLLGQAYARDQVQAAIDSRPMTCTQLRQFGVPEGDCAPVQESQAASRRALDRLATRVGPAGAAAHARTGIASLVLGHAITVPGLFLLAALAAIVLGGEASAGVAAMRDGALLGPASAIVRPLALLLVWLVAIGTAIVITMVASIGAHIAQPWHGSTGPAAATSVLLGRVVAAAGVGTMGAVAIDRLRGCLNSPGRLLVGSMSLAVAALVLVSVAPPWLPPTNAPWNIATFDPIEWSYLDRLPVALVADGPNRINWALAVLVPLLVFVGSAGFARRERR